MAMKLTVTDNFSGLVAYKKENKHYFACLQDKVLKRHKSLDIRPRDLLNQKSFQFFSFTAKPNDLDGDELILSIHPGERSDQHEISTGNFIGDFSWDGAEIKIVSRFPDALLKRMLNVANDVFLDDVSVFPVEQSKNLDVARMVIYHLFVQKLERAFLLGLPKSYQTQRHHVLRLRGNVDINSFIRRDIPFQGRISSVSREQIEDQAMIDVLDRAVRMIERAGRGLTRNIRNASRYLRERRSGQFVSKETIRKARESKALHNPMFTPYRKLLDYAELILQVGGMQESAKGKKEVPGFLVNVAELFETYVSKLLQYKFPGWIVESPKIDLYEGMFYARKIIPDIVMTKENDVMVFDVKYKRMTMRGTKEGSWDLDRNDFFQIHTYMGYYANRGKRLIAGGLLYPMEKQFNPQVCHSDSWIGKSGVRFVVDGLDLTNLSEGNGGNVQAPDAGKKIDIAKAETENRKHIIAAEEAFLKRIGKLMDASEVNIPLRDAA